MLLLKDSDLTQAIDLKLEAGDKVVSASICDPYLSLLTSSGTAIVLQLSQGKLGVIKTKVGQAAFMAASLYKDRWVLYKLYTCALYNRFCHRSGLLTSEVRGAGRGEKRGKGQAKDKTEEELDDEDELLYGSR